MQPRGVQHEEFQMTMTPGRRPSNVWSTFEDTGVDLETQLESVREGAGGEGMPMYMMLSRLTERGRDRVKNHPERILEVNHEVEQRGCLVVAQYALMGPHDFVTIIKAPNNAVMHKLAIDLGARGTIETETYPAMPTDDFIAVMKESGD
jgi:uncharacterized protein with GYD domain